MAKARVYFTREITPQAMDRLYDALGIDVYKRQAKGSPIWTRSSTAEAASYSGPSPLSPRIMESASST